MTLAALGTAYLLSLLAYQEEPGSFYAPCKLNCGETRSRCGGICAGCLREELQRRGVKAEVRK